MKVIVTGSVGFIGFHLCEKLLESNFEVIGIDNINTYYDPKLKNARLNNIKKHSKSKDFHFFKVRRCNSGVGVGHFFGIFIFSKSGDVTAVLELGVFFLWFSFFSKSGDATAVLELGDF